MAMIGPVISSMALMVAVAGVEPRRHEPFDVFQHHDRVIDDNADGEHQAEQGQVVKREAQQQP